MEVRDCTPKRVKDVLSSFSHEIATEDASQQCSLLLAVTRTGNGDAAHDGSPPSKGPKPTDRAAFFNRVQTYSTWFAKPAWLSALACAQYGWVNVEVDLLRCVGCRKHLSGRMPTSFEPQVYAECCTKLANSLKTAHSKYCCWVSNPSPESFLRLPVDSPAMSELEFNSLLESILALREELPRIDEAQIDAMGITRNMLLALRCDVDVTRQSRDDDVSHDQDDLFCSACLLAVCGWASSSLAGVSRLHCRHCNRTAGLWNYHTYASPLPSQPDDDNDTSHDDTVCQSPRMSITLASTEEDESDRSMGSEDHHSEDHRSVGSEDRRSVRSEDCRSARSEDRRSVRSVDQHSVESEDHFSMESVDHHSVGSEDHCTVKSEDCRSVGSEDRHSVGSEDDHSVGSEDHRSVGSEDRRSVGSEDHHSVGSEDHHSVGSEDHCSVGSEDHRSVGSEDHHSVGSKDRRSVESGDRCHVGSVDRRSVGSEDRHRVGSEDHCNLVSKDHISVASEDHLSVGSSSDDGSGKRSPSEGSDIRDGSEVEEECAQDRDSSDGRESESRSNSDSESDSQTESRFKGGRAKGNRQIEGVLEVNKSEVLTETEILSESIGEHDGKTHFGETEHCKGERSEEMETDTEEYHDRVELVDTTESDIGELIFQPENDKEEQCEQTESDKGEFIVQSESEKKEDIDRIESDNVENVEQTKKDAEEYTSQVGSDNEEQTESDKEKLVKQTESDEAECVEQTETDEIEHVEQTESDKEENVEQTESEKGKDVQTESDEIEHVEQTESDKIKHVQQTESDEEEDVEQTESDKEEPSRQTESDEEDVEQTESDKVECVEQTEITQEESIVQTERGEHEQVEQTESDKMECCEQTESDTSHQHDVVSDVDGICESADIEKSTNVVEQTDISNIETADEDIKSDDEKTQNNVFQNGYSSCESETEDVVDDSKVAKDRQLVEEVRSNGCPEPMDVDATGTHGSKSCKRTLGDDGQGEGSNGQQSGQSGVEEVLEPAAKRAKITKPCRVTFDPVAEHHPWCPWVLTDKRSDKPSEDNARSGHVDGKPGWKQFLEVLTPTGSRQSENLIGIVKTSPLCVGMQSVRKLFRGWINSESPDC